MSGRRRQHEWPDVGCQERAMTRAAKTYDFRPVKELEAGLLQLSLEFRLSAHLAKNISE